MGQRGYSLVALMAGITMAMLVMGAALPAWRYVVKDDREQELLFRGWQIADAIQRFQKKTGAYPASLEVMVKGRYLRKLYKDPMTKDGKWRFVPPNVGVVPGTGGTQPGPGTPPTTRPSSPGGTGGTVGAIGGVASVSNDEGYRVYNGKKRYSEWLFGPNLPRVVGKVSQALPVPGPSPKK